MFSILPPVKFDVWNPVYKQNSSLIKQSKTVTILNFEKKYHFFKKERLTSFHLPLFLSPPFLSVVLAFNKQRKQNFSEKVSDKRKASGISLRAN